MDLYAPDFTKSASKFYIVVFYKSKHPIWRRFRFKKPPHYCNTYSSKKKVIFCQRYIEHMRLKMFE